MIQFISSTMCSNIILIFLLSSCIFVIVIDGASEGDVCRRHNKPGVCRNLNYCQEAIDDIYANLTRPQFCGFSGTEAIVCCFDQDNRGATTAKPLECKPLPDNLAAKRTGRKAMDKCIEYQETLVYPCQRRADIRGILRRSDFCGHGGGRSPTQRRLLVVGGTKAGYGEFPHTVLLGYNDTEVPNLDKVPWLCSGTLISERFIMTAGHCANTREYGPVTFARLNLLNTQDPIDSPDQHWYLIGRIIRHPEYKPPNRYNDIALLETSTIMQLDRYTVPACLPVSDNLDINKATVTGWGVTSFGGTFSPDLLKVSMDKFPTPSCKEEYPPTRHMREGLKESLQLCYGSNETEKGTCQGDSGGGLVIDNPDVHCMYTVVGLVSFGKGCGIVGVPEVYTRIAAYMDWIEQTVWP